MKNWVVFADKQGSGYITTDEQDIKQGLQEQQITIALETLLPGTPTDLRGYFRRKIKYLGFYNNNEMIFYVGKKQSLFETNYYYTSVFKIDENRIFEMFGPDFGRDHFLINGVWK